MARGRNKAGKKKRGTSWLRRLVVAVGVSLAVILVGGAAAGAGVVWYYSRDLPSIEELRQGPEGYRARAPQTTRIETSDGVLIGELFDERRTVVPFERIPRDLVSAVLAAEDADFYQHEGLDYPGILRALFINLREGRVAQGASTITQQVVGTFLPEIDRTERSFERKIREAILAMELSRRYSKDQILEWYLNTNNYGNRAYGVEAAAQNYYGKHAWELDLAECAMLAAIPQYPAANSPVENPDRAKSVREAVLTSMVREGYITQSQAETAASQPLNVVTKEYDIKAPHFVFYVRQLLEEKYSLPMVYRGGLKIYTTLDLSMQDKVQEIAREHVASMKPEQNVHNAAVVVLNTNTAEILTMLGSLDYYNKGIDGQVNVALAERQPGSSFKPFTYVTAFSLDWTPANMVLDVRTSFADPPHPPYIPENVDGKFLGPITLRYALANSRNIPALKVMDHVGVQNVLDMAHKMGINTLNREGVYGLSLTLGGGEVTLLDEAFAYMVFANAGQAHGEPIPVERQREGYREVNPVAILKVVDAEGRTLYEYQEPTKVPVLSTQLAWLVTSILSDNRARRETFGWDTPLEIDRPAVVKTGSTNNWRDSWTLGFTPDYTVGVWVGNSDNTAMDRVPGSQGAGPIWHN
ncbi:MAG: transglycosylase domain-containing protein, partial [Chloroflexi bacterium]|nr:transglycosylase domain-containing protein [Chloroflexota bacterium]